MSEMAKIIAGILYTTAAMVMVPWTHHLWRTLPDKQDLIRWRHAWVGFDVGLIICLLTTGILLLNESFWAVITAVMAATLLLADAWFVVMTAHSGKAKRQAWLLAAFLEVPIAVTSICLVVLYLKGIAAPF